MLISKRDKSKLFRYLTTQRFVLEQSLPIQSSGLDRQAGPSLRLGLLTTTEIITSINAAD